MPTNVPRGDSSAILNLSTVKNTDVIFAFFNLRFLSYARATVDSYNSKVASYTISYYSYSCLSCQVKMFVIP